MHLENEHIRVAFDPETGGFTSLYDKRLGHEYIEAPDRANPLRLMVPEPGRDGRHFDAARAAIAIEDGRARVAYRLGETEAVATYRLEGDALLAELTLTHHGDHPVEEVMFPLVRGIGGFECADIVCPCFWGRRIDSPLKAADDELANHLGGDHHTWNDWTQKANARYPQYLCSAWCDFGSPAHGIALEGRQQDFSPLDFFFYKQVEKRRDPVRRTLDMMTVHPHRVKQGETYTTSPVRIVLHRGGWESVATAHRDWLETWIQKPDRPRKFAESIGWHFFFMKHQDGLEVFTYDDLPRMAEAALAAGCPYLMLFGWHTGGHDNNYWYRYVPNEDWGGEAALRQAVEQCRALGAELLPFFNGTLANIEMPEHKEFGYQWEAKTRAGHPYYAGDWARANFDVPMRNRAMLHHEMCFCDGQRAYFLDSIRRIVQQYGFANTQLDQISEKLFLCFNELHGHAHPDRAMVDGLAELLAETRRIVREANPEGVLVSESLNDFTGQWCDSSWDWTLLLPFPDPILLTLPWVFGSLEVDALEYGRVNEAFAFKLHLDMKIDGGDAAVTDYPEFAGHVRRNAELRRRTADYYVFGDFRAHERMRLDAEDGVAANVFYNREANKVGIVAADVGGRGAHVVIESDWPARGTVVLDSNLAPEQRLDPAHGYAFSLEPHEVKVLCIDL